MFFWSLLPILDVLILFFSFYFIFSFITKKDLRIWNKLLFLILFFPVILFVPTSWNITNFKIEDCIATENILFINYYVVFWGLITLISTSIFLIKQFVYRKKERTEVILTGVGILLFLFSFFTTSYLSSILGDYNNSNNIEQYGLFGMPVFMAFLAYLIVKFKAFNIKLLGAQALVAALVILVGSQFFYVQNLTSQILTGVTLALTLGAGWALVRSVKISEKRKEELQKLSDSLAVANEKLKQLDRAKSDFFARASHDLRTPITSIKGFVSLLEEGSYGEMNDKQKEALKKTATVATNMSALVEDFLTAAKLDAGGMQYDFAKHKIEDICQQIADTLYPKSKDKGLYLDFQKPAEALPELMIDGARIRESISNLVDNALKYTDKGGLTIKLERAEFSKHKPSAVYDPDKKITPEISGPVARITISDTGIGIPEEEIPRLFARFSRGKDTSRLNASGTGLGLYVCKGMIEGNGGKVWAESDGKGKGSRFIVELPIDSGKE